MKMTKKCEENGCQLATIDCKDITEGPFCIQQQMMDDIMGESPLLKYLTDKDVT